MPLAVTHHGAVDGVTGSCHQLTLPEGPSVLVDCGLFQGAETSPDRAGAHQLEIGFALDKVRALIVTMCTSTMSTAFPACWRWRRATRGPS